MFEYPATAFFASCFPCLLNWVNSTSAPPRSAEKTYSLKFVPCFEILYGGCYLSAATHLNSLTASTVFGKGATEEYQMLQAQMKVSLSK